MSHEKIAELEKQIFDLTAELNGLRKLSESKEVSNYHFETQSGPVRLLDLFADKERLLVIHNMGQGCRYCTLWADGINAFVPHLESAMAVALVSKDDAETQRRFANERGWRFRLASHGGGDYIREQSCSPGHDNAPGAVIYQRDGDRILRKNSCEFGPGDLYCSMWSLLALAGMGEAEWTPQYTYWKRPEKLDDGGANLPD